MPNRGFFFLLLLLIGAKSTSTTAQQRPVDSLLLLAEKAGNDSLRIGFLNEAAKAYWRISPDSSLLVANKALSLAEEFHFNEGIANALNNKGAANYFMGNFQQAESEWEKVLEVRKQMNDHLGMGKIYGNLGLVAERSGDFHKALSFHQISAEIKMENGASAEQLGIAFNNIGIVYEKIGDFPLAEEYHLKALKIRDSLQHLPHLSSTYMNLAIVYDKQGKNDLAKEFYHLSLGLKQTLNDNWGTAGCLANLGEFYRDNQQFDSAQIYFDQALSIAKQLKALDVEGRVLAGKAQNLLLQGKTSEALISANQAYGFLSHPFPYAELMEIEHVRHTASASVGNYQKAYQHLLGYLAAKDSVMDIEKAREIGKLEAKYVFEKEQLVEKQKQLEKEARLLASISRHEFRQFVEVFLGVFILAVGLVLYRAYRLVLKKNRQLQAQKEEISYLNNHLEEKVKARTLQLEKRNQQMADFAFTNAHKVRGPLARILGLIQVINLDHKLTKEEKAQLLQAIDNSANELDDIVREVSRRLGE